MPGNPQADAVAINSSGDAVGLSFFTSGCQEEATKWSGGAAIDLGGLPGAFYGQANAINASGQAVGYNSIGLTNYAVEWSGGAVIDLGGLPVSTQN